MFKSTAATNHERITQEGNDEIVLVIKQLIKEQKKTNELLTQLLPKEEVPVEEVPKKVTRTKKEV